MVEAGQNAWRRRGFRPTSGEEASGWAFERNPLIAALRASNPPDGELRSCKGFVRAETIFIPEGEMYKNRIVVHIYRLEREIPGVKKLFFVHFLYIDPGILVFLEDEYQSCSGE